ncbi:MAG: SDR family oxidoreductase [Myxococcales bacterium]|nr:MAG: SDR family oxidoreductase [Myxococcales bacterium]
MTRIILITGATGSVSSALIRSLKGASGVRLRALVRDASKAPALRAQGLEVTPGDLDEPESLSQAFAGVNDLWLLNGVTPRQPENSMNALWAAKQAGVERVVRLSAIGASPDAPTRNGRLHALSDAELMSSGLKWTILRPHFYLQNLLMAASAIGAQGNLYWDMGEGKLAMIDVRDVAEVAAKVLLSDPGAHHGKIYTPTGPASLSLAQAASELAAGLGKPVRYVPVPHEAARKSMLDSGMPPWVVGLLGEYSRAYAKDWGNFTTSHLPELLGRPARSVREFAQDHGAAFGAAAGGAA